MESYNNYGYMHGIVKARPGTGKCLGFNTPVLMYNGDIKMVQDIKDNDLLMGVDSKSRIVSGVNVDYGDMYRVILENGEEFSCNYDHILSLRSEYIDNELYPYNSIVNISIKNYLNQDDSFKNHMKLWKVGVEFNGGAVELSEDPYDVGYRIGVLIKKNTFNTKWKYKIKKEYLITSMDNRLRLLSGLIDSVGVVVCDNSKYEIICNNAVLLDQICYLTRSLSFYCDKNNDIYSMCVISGNLSRLVCKKEQHNDIISINDDGILKSSFVIKYIGKDTYYGFELSDDKLYLLGDFTVTHNTVLGIYLAHKMRVPTLISIDNNKIVKQWTDEACKHTSLTENDIGLIKGNKFDVEDKPIIMTTPQTLSSKFKNMGSDKEFYNKFKEIGIGLVIQDECFPPSVEVLTDKGFLPFNRLGYFEKIAQYDTDTSEISFVKPLSYTCNEFKDDLVKIYDDNGFQIISTPKHDQLVCVNNEYKKVHMDNVEFNDYTTIPLHGNSIGNGDEFNEYHRFLIMVQLRGEHVHNYETGESYILFTIDDEYNDQMINRFTEILYSLKYQFQLVSDNGHTEVYKCMYQFDDAIYRCFDEWVKLDEVSSDFASQFINEVIFWSGSRNNTDKIYRTVNYQNSETLYNLAILSGNKCDRQIIKNNNELDVHELRFYKDYKINTRSFKKQYIEYDGDVYCVTVPKGNIIVRYGDSVIVTGNCHKIANQWASASLLINTPNYIGLSATPWHDRDKAKLLYSLYGEVVTEYGEYDFSPEIKQVVYDSGLDAKYGKRLAYLWKKNFIMARSIYNTALLESQIWVDVCVKIMKHCMDENLNNRMIVIAFTKKQIELLYNGAKNAGLKPIKFYGGENEVDKANDRLLIATQKYASEAFDYEQLNRLLLSVPLLGKKSIVQTTGRILRNCAGKESAIVYDLFDNGKQFRNLFMNTIPQKMKIINTEYDNVQVSQGNIDEILK